MAFYFCVENTQTFKRYSSLFLPFMFLKSSIIKKNTDLVLLSTFGYIVHNNNIDKTLFFKSITIFFKKASTRFKIFSLVYNPCREASFDLNHPCDPKPNKTSDISLWLKMGTLLKRSKKHFQCFNINSSLGNLHLIPLLYI